MLSKILVVVSGLYFAALAWAQPLSGTTLKVHGSTVDLFLSGRPSDSTVMYLPGCNGRDAYGAKYQDFHVTKMAAAWSGQVNIVRLQLVNDVTQGTTNGTCFWTAEKNRQEGTESYELAKKAGDIARDWVSKQAWFNGNLHFFGFSFGGRVSLMVNFIAATRGQFKTVTGIWPLCRKDYPIKAHMPHTPSRFYSTEDDPLAEIRNCRSFYPNGGGEMIEIITYPGRAHSWMTHPDVKDRRVWWPNHGIWSESRYIEEYAEKTWSSWSAWARCREGGSATDSCHKQ
jgi:dienelactone hydrolase